MWYTLNIYEGCVWIKNLIRKKEKEIKIKIEKLVNMTVVNNWILKFFYFRFIFAQQIYLWSKRYYWFVHPILFENKSRLQSPVPLFQTVFLPNDRSFQHLPCGVERDLGKWDWGDRKLLLYTLHFVDSSKQTFNFCY